MRRTLGLVLVAIALLAHLASAPSLLAAVSASIPDQPTEPRDCCSTESEPADCEAPPEPGACCPDGCTHCPLSCCGAIPAIAGGSSARLDTTMVTPALLAPTCSVLPTIDPREIYHPPRI